MRVGLRALFAAATFSGRVTVPVMKRASSSTSDPAPKRARDAPTLDKPALRSLAAELSAPQHAIDNAVALLVDGHTVPFIARYRQQQTGGLEPPASAGACGALAPPSCWGLGGPWRLVAG